MRKLIICVVLLVNLLFTGVHCKPVEDTEKEEEEEETVVLDYVKMEPGDTYEKKPDIYIFSASGSGDGGEDYEDPSASSSYKVPCPPIFVDMWMKIFSTYPDKCMKDVDSDDGASNDEENS